jgi:hypothetical protein
MTRRVSDYAARNRIPPASRGFTDTAVTAAAASALPANSGMKLLVASIVLSVLVLWALGCGVHV